MDPLDALVALLLLGSIVLVIRPRSIPRGLFDQFGAGFLPYRPDDGWPLHVQEEEPRAWAWRASDASELDTTEPRHLQPEIIETEVAGGSGATLERVSIAHLGWSR
jgi:hypothetical protein